ncbi:MAG: co-chaperone GroES, partial [Ignavibacteriaceae bacterium]|nr:co-chaperone GroES [Ignavibacteriaceae bacterium]
AAGPGKISDNGELVKMAIKVGDKVLYGKYSGTEVTIEGEEYLIMRESDIFAIIP